MLTKIYLVSQEKRCDFLDNVDYSFIYFQRAFNNEKDAYLYLSEIERSLLNDGYEPYHDSDESLYGNSEIPTFYFHTCDKFVKLTIKQIFLT